MVKEKDQVEGKEEHLIEEFDETLKVDPIEEIDEVDEEQEEEEVDESPDEYNEEVEEEEVDETDNKAVETKKDIVEEQKKKNKIKEIIGDDLQVEMDEVTDTEGKVDEYFSLKDTLKTLRQDLKDHKENHIDYEELQEVSQKVKELRDNIKHDEDINIIQEKAAEIKERMDMLKEIIKMELIQTDQEEVKRDGRKLKIVPVLKEMKDEDGKLN